MAGWQDLATELIIQIVSFLDQQSLASTSIVSHLLHAASEPHLYASLALGAFKETDMYPPSRRAKNCDVVRHLIRTLVRRPQLCGLVRNLKIGDWKSSGDHSPESHETLLNELNSPVPDAEAAERFLGSKSHDECAELALVIKAAKGVGMSVGWIYNHDEPFWGLLILIFHQLPRLHTLSFTELGSAKLVSDLTRGLISGGIPKCIPTIATFALLPAVQHIFPHREDHNDVLFGLALSLPNLTSICISGVRITSPEHTSIRRKPTGSVRHVEFRRCRYISSTPIKQLSEFLRIASELESFAFVEEDVAKQSASDRHEFIYCDELGAALAAHITSLSSLYISCGVHGDGRLAPITVKNSIGSLQNFTVLKHVRIRADMLIGDRRPLFLAGFRLSGILPSSLVTLHIIITEKWSLRHFINVTGCPEYWDQESLYFPALESFTIQHLPFIRNTVKQYETLDAEVLSAFGLAKIKLLPPIGMSICIVGLS